MAFLVMEALHAIVEGKLKVNFEFMERFEPPWKRIKKVNAQSSASGKV